MSAIFVRLVADRRVRYLCAGGIAAVLYYAAFAAGWALTAHRLPYLLIAVLANLVTAPPIYQLYRRLVFRATGPWLAGFLKFYVLAVGSLLFTLVGLPLLVEALHLHVLLAQAIVLVVSPLINYQLSRVWAFRGAPEGPSTQAPLRASTTNPLASTPASGCRASSTSTILSGDSTHISGTSAR
ncbi:GtrA family protein [Spirilliplanes yamanashiensis]|uniref:GtrA family protein n=1 Tax=Spirilliplanes yamanashiensis TaxID=42233 RepID=UPI001EF34851|nr:GtrA family protein [Spirilliplanes yamanashiensis]MDP9816473.1 putative flippase GtrA [Spirilliplanes yamanashiensis]